MLHRMNKRASCSLIFSMPWRHYKDRFCRVLDAIMLLDNKKWALIFSTKSWIAGSTNKQWMSSSQSSCRVYRKKEVLVRENPSTPVLQEQRQEASVVTVPSTDKGRSKGKGKSKRGRATPPSWQVVAPTTPELQNPSTPPQHLGCAVEGESEARLPSPLTPGRGVVDDQGLQYSTPQLTPRCVPDHHIDVHQVHDSSTQRRPERGQASDAGQQDGQHQRLVTPHTCSPTQPRQQYPLQQEQGDKGQAAASAFGSVCNKAMLQTQDPTDENSTAVAINCALNLQREQRQRGEAAALEPEAECLYSPNQHLSANTCPGCTSGEFG